jgi:integrase
MVLQARSLQRKPLYPDLYPELSMPKLSEIALTDKAVRNAKPKTRRYEISDAVVRGLRLRVEPSGTKSWSVVRRQRARLTRDTIGRYPELRLAEAREKAAAITQGSVSIARGSRSFEDVFDEWMQRDQQSNRSAKEVRRAMERDALPRLRGLKIGEVKKHHLLSVIDAAADRGATVAGNRLLAYLRRMFSWAVQRDLIDANPASGVGAVVREQSRARVLTLTELRGIFRAASGLLYPFGPMFQLLLLTAQRRREVASAEWGEFDLASRRWIIPGNRTKNGRAHLVHLSEVALPVLSGCEVVRRGAFVFTTTGTSPVSGFSKAKERIDKITGVQDWTIHDLRRSFATLATEELGVSPVVVDKILNHVSGSVRGVAAVYQRGEYLEQRSDALEKWARYVCDSGNTSADSMPMNRKFGNVSD